MCSPINEGALRVRNLLMFYLALLGKLLWRYAYKREALWRMVVDVKYVRQRGGWCSNGVIGSYGVGLWKFIRRGWGEFSRYEVGNGSVISFWNDMWCGEQPLKAKFQELFSIACLGDAFVVNHPQFYNCSAQWNINLLEQHDWELEFFSLVCNQVYSINLKQEDVDKLCWKPFKRWLSDVRMFYNVLIPMLALPFLEGVFGIVRPL